MNVEMETKFTKEEDKKYTWISNTKVPELIAGKWDMGHKTADMGKIQIYKYITIATIQVSSRGSVVRKSSMKLYNQ